MGIGELSALAVAFLVALGSLLFARFLRESSPTSVTLMRCASGALALALAGVAFDVAWRGVSFTTVIMVIGSGVVGVAIADVAFFKAVSKVGVPRALLMLSSAPVFAATGGWLWMGESLGPQSQIGILLVSAGIAIVVMRPRPAAAEVRSTSPGPQPSRSPLDGLLLGLLAGVATAVGGLLLRRAMEHGIPPIHAAVVRLSTGAVTLTLAMIAAGTAHAGLRRLATRHTWLKLIAISIVLTSLVGWLQSVALHSASSTGVAVTLMSTSPIFALPLAHFAHAERMTLRVTIGVIAAVAGVAALLMTR